VVYVKADIETCKQRDYKGAYAKALGGEFKTSQALMKHMKSRNAPK